ncbi:ArsR/SmtB family transcription factor [Sutcliffiella cohnii]|uniref:Transcriptional regulator n=1 Tax=Sutcliffiella cohnii TaxID=33932 RepID=A0A223KTA9_9BACI|nr:metalloregulator ArsR/SmtB family transcription factor [Sutcliffiella cohnii]AST92563.1 transcriptional regulator [Sutcliffiella cohnii]
MSESLDHIENAAITLKALSDKTRLSMVALMQHHECCVCEFVEIFKMSQPSISQHLRKLKDIGLVKESRRGQWIIYSLNDQHDHYPLLKSILSHVPNLQEKMDELEVKGLRISCK